MTSSRPTPKFVGVDTYKDPKGRYNFRFPIDWHQFQLADRREGVMLSPQASSPQTWISAWITDLKEHVVAEDLHVLRQGVERGLSELRDVHVEQASDDVLSNLIKFERIFTFHDGVATRKWRQWLLYVDHWLIVLTFQGESPEEYDHWYAMTNYTFMTFNLPNELWFAVDRDLSGLMRKAGVPIPGEEAPEGLDDDEDDEDDEGEKA